MGTARRDGLSNAAADALCLALLRFRGTAARPSRKLAFLRVHVVIEKNKAVSPPYLGILKREAER